MVVLSVRMAVLLLNHKKISKSTDNVICVKRLLAGQMNAKNATTGYAINAILRQRLVKRLVVAQMDPAVEMIRLLSMGKLDVDGALKLKVTLTLLVLSTLSSKLKEIQDVQPCGTF